MTILIDAENKSYKIKYPFVINNLSKIGMGASSAL